MNMKYKIKFLEKELTARQAILDCVGTTPLKHILHFTFTALVQ